MLNQVRTQSECQKLFEAYLRKEEPMAAIRSARIDWIWKDSYYYGWIRIYSGGKTKLRAYHICDDGRVVRVI